MGAMVFGNPNNERIQLNEDSLWAGPGETMVDAKGTPQDLAELRKLIDEGKLVEADDFIVEKFSRGKIIRAHQTLGDLHIKWQDTEQEVTNYRRELDLKSALTTTRWKRGSTHYTQEVFCSNPDETLFVQISADGPGTLDFDLILDRPKDEGHTTHQTIAEGSKLTMTGQVTQREGLVDGKNLPDMKGVKFHVILAADTTEGTITEANGTLQVRGAKKASLRIVASTDFWSAEQTVKHLAGASQKADYTRSKERHIIDHQTLYNRCELSLPSDPELIALPTDKRLANLTEDNADHGLESLLFHYGRYLLIASSRINGNPANLQGLWNHEITPPWNSDYHLNINLQMNYWPAEVTNLSETHLPVFKWMQSLARRGAITAKEQYGMRGWMAHQASELRAPATMKSTTAHYGSWIHGGGWMCQHVWTHYAYTQDKVFLRDTGYPLLAGQSRFYLDWLVEKDGRLISTPETSPENSFLTADGISVAVCAKAAMGQQIIHEVFSNTLAAAKELGIDDSLTQEISAALPKLDSGLHIGSDGRLLEWDKPYEEAEKGHRHLSHLYAFHPGITVTQEKTPEILKAVKKSINFREQHGSVGIGWSRAWAISIYARLRDGNTARHHIHEMLRTQTLGNGFNSIFGHKHHLFQIEANLGATAGIAEMLIQSHGGFIHLLPALPTKWKNGSVKGLRAVGGYTVDIDWKDGSISEYQISHPTLKQAKIYLNGEFKTIICQTPSDCS